MSHDTLPQTPDAFDENLVDLLVEEHLASRVPRLQRLWDYYRNEPESGTPGGNARTPQHAGLPERLRPHDGRRRREVVIENDIAWRVHALVDFMFGKPFTLDSTASHPARALLLSAFLREVFRLNGGIRFFQDLGLLGSVYGYVDVLLRLGSAPANHSPNPGGVSGPRRTGRDAVAQDTDPHRAALPFRLETIEPPAAVPVLHPSDYRETEAYLIHTRHTLNEAAPRTSLRRSPTGSPRARTVIERTELWTPRWVVRSRGRGDRRELIDRRVNRLGRIPVVHIQNLPQPFFYEGLSEVEPLVPLQDELNTRLSDRANRVTFQSFKMYLGKGIDGFHEMPVGPGQMWSTDNPDASIEAIGGDSESPSETAHINELREAMDKASAVSPVAAGLLRGRVGNLTSANALRLTLMGLVARTERKRISYGEGIERLCELLLHAADVTGVLPNEPAERGVRIDWPSPIPENESQRLQDARLKLELGVPRDRVLAELGYPVTVSREEA